MKRMEQIRRYVDSVLNKIPDDFNRKCAYIHLYGVSELAAMLSLKRGLQPEVAAAAGMLHDIYAYRTGFRKYHSHNSAEDARPIIRDMDIFSEEEQKLILSAVFHHSDKAHVHDAYDEIIKDTDILERYLYDASIEKEPHKAERLKRTLEEMGLPIPGNLTGIGNFGIEKAVNKAGKQSKNGKSADVHARLADIAGLLAQKGIEGSPANSDFMDIARHWPDTLLNTSLNELVGGWCAAFVFHCCIEAGFKLPIRYPGTTCRLAAVQAWYEWAKKPEVGLFIDYSPDLLPERGDIVVYCEIISSDKKPEGSGSFDHIGIVLSCAGDTITVAEGNADNSNKSAVVKRYRFEKIAGYIRINNDYTYEGWKYDYKTGSTRVESL